jgi:tetratricopeptide (TPR) repeat protein
LPLVVCGLGAIVLVTYANSLDAGFTSDSEFIIRRAARVHQATWANVVEIVTTDYWWPGNVTGVYRPVTTLSYLLNWAVLGNGDRPAGYHWVNLLLHWGNAVSVYAIGRRALGVSMGAAFLGAALFATHPVATEAVTNLVGRADLLAALAVLVGFLLYVRAVRAAGAGRVLWLASVAIAGLAGALSKENAVVLLPVLVLYDVVVRSGTWDATGVVRLTRGSVAALGPPLAIVWAIRRAIFRATPPTSLDFAQNVLVGADWWTARLTALKLIGRSCWLLLWPARLCPDYSVNEIPLFGGRLGSFEDWQVPIAAVVIVALLVVAFRLHRRMPTATFVIGFFCVALLPTSNLLFPLGAVMAERFLYLPLAAAALGVALVVDGIVNRLGNGPAVHMVRGSIAVVVAICALRSARRNVDWRDDVSLWTAAVASCPASYRSHDALASALAAALPADDVQGDGLERVIAEEETARAILERHAPPGAPVPAFVLARLGSFYLSEAKRETDRQRAGVSWAVKAMDVLEAAAAQYQEETRSRGQGTAEALEVGTPRLYEDLGLALLYAGRLDAAVDAFVHARSLSAGSAEPYLNLATAYARLGRSEDALVSVLEARLVDPGGAGSPQVVYDLYRHVDPGGCAVTADGGQVRVHPDCPAARTFVCRAYSGLAAALADARNTPAAERTASVERFRRGAEETFHCADLGYDDLRPSTPRR